MIYDPEKARRYRQHAANLRAIAADCEEPETAVMLIGVAHDYEQMARVFDATDFNSVTARYG